MLGTFVYAAWLLAQNIRADDDYGSRNYSPLYSPHYSPLISTLLQGVSLQAFAGGYTVRRLDGVEESLTPEHVGRLAEEQLAATGLPLALPLLEQQQISEEDGLVMESLSGVPPRLAQDDLTWPSFSSSPVSPEHASEGAASQQHPNAAEEV